MTDIFIFVASLGLLLALDYLSVAARVGFLQTNHARLLALREQTGQQINQTVSLLTILPRLKASLNLTLVMVRFLIAGLVLLYVSRQDIGAPILVAIIALLVAALVVFWFEWGVERRVAQSPETWAVRMTPFARLWMAGLMWLLLLPLGLGNETQSAYEGSGAVTEDELMSLVDAGQEEGLFEQGERRMIFSIIQLGETLAREIMVPRIDMLALDVHTPLPDAVDALLRSGHSRVPVYEETVDKTLGLLYAKDLLRVWREGNQIESLRTLLRPAYFVPEAKKVDELLTELQTQRIHMAIVVDEYGGVAGLVTLEDIIEEVIGEIRDEYDQAEESVYQALGDGEYLFQGRVDLDDFNEIMESNLPKDEADTLGGYIYSRLGRVPTVGETVLDEDLSLTVEQVSARRIRKVRARWLAPAGSESGDDKNGLDG